MNSISAYSGRKIPNGLISSVTLSVLALALSTINASSQPVDSLDIKIGQMILIGFPKAEVDSSVIDEVRKGKAGSIIIFEKNIPAKNSFVALKKIIWTYQRAAPIPLFVAIDQEGGKVNRLKDKYGFPRSITAAAMGQNRGLDSVRFYADATASTLAGLGINLNFAPVVDLASNPDNPIIARHGRAFSANEDSVTIYAKEFIRQHRKYNVLTSLKHFPGHGSSKADTHLGIADVTNTWEERELAPYRALIDSGFADAVMTSHIVNRKLDSNGNPGTLSNVVITGILRQRLHFDGVVFSDDMQMHAITKHFGFDEAVKLAINAGVDVMTFSNNISGSDLRTVDRVHQLIRQMVERGEIKRERIDESYRRVMALKKKMLAANQVAYLKQELEKAKIENEILREELSKKPTATEVVPPDTKKKKKKKKSR
ncbi:MAG TPA: glycoside hydrolase family 3 N-terminal domain-containing protein [Ohtaekwangia sp.]|nr:glycoside hydrolase family 3 N-terminal domain-containing protein [Ohtaekwangia sp.]